METALPKILIVDDESASRDPLAKLLTASGFDVRTAANSQEAIEEMASFAPETVLLDIDLPHIPGDSIATFLNIRYPRTRIIFMSGQYEMVDPERFGEQTLYFRKPIAIEELLSVLSNKQPPATASA